MCDSVVKPGYLTYNLQPFTYADERVLSRQEQFDTHSHDLATVMHVTLQNTLAMLPEVRWRHRPSVDIDVVFDQDAIRVVLKARGWIMQRTDGSTWMLP